MSERDGGPAFPHDGQANYTGGMTLRDWFAGMAMQGMLASQHAEVWGSYDKCAVFAYDQADAMLQAREQNDD